MARRSGLGKGLGALIPGDRHEHVQSGEGAVMRELPIDSIQPNRYQPRTTFDEASLDELAASIAEVGVLQPILVRPADGRTDAFELVAGERRWRSARLAGLTTVPALIQTQSDLHSLAVALIENLHRTDLNPLEEAAAYQQLIDDFGITHEQVGEAVSKSRPAISNALRLLNLPPAVQLAVSEGRLSAGHARALLPILDRDLLEVTAAKVEADGMSVRAVEELVKTMNARPQGPVELQPDDDDAPAREAVLPDAGITELEHLLERHLDTRVRVDFKGRRGRVIVDFADLDDLERIYRAVTGVTP